MTLLIFNMLKKKQNNTYSIYSYTGIWSFDLHFSYYPDKYVRVAVIGAAKRDWSAKLLANEYYFAIPIFIIKSTLNVMFSLCFISGRLKKKIKKFIIYHVWELRNTNSNVRVPIDVYIWCSWSKIFLYANAEPLFITNYVLLFYGY